MSACFTRAPNGNFHALVSPVLSIPFMRGFETGYRVACALYIHRKCASVSVSLSDFEFTAPLCKSSDWFIDWFIAIDSHGAYGKYALISRGDQRCDFDFCIYRSIYVHRPTRGFNIATKWPGLSCLVDVQCLIVFSQAPCRDALRRSF